ncbi:hypothetical protein Mal52_57090 [Symmachiella dynata]|uniref:VWFA domain-containing protein n=1 Tax=Symmachiella dynata TaxID=2527995 RepID=A0A517ZXH6_9PLAN|nr:hypothetical protein [Symmachiella dynata]QDU47181.1 hypothetical protein Mal52_57090 [Symmachiella dynata]
MEASNIIFQGRGLWWLWLSLAALAAAGVIFLYRYERRLVAARIGNSLLALRLSAIALLFFALLQPVLAVVRERAAERRILIAIDVSQSMQTPDPQASDAEKLRWARALGTIGNDHNRDRIDQWLQALENEQEPKWVASGDGEAAVQLAQTRRDSLHQLLDEIGALQRREIVQRILTSTTTPLLAKLQRIGDVQIHLFADKAVAVDGDALSLMDLNEQELGLNVGVTNLQAGIAAGTSSVEQPSTAGIVLLTDGRDTSTHDPIATARALGRENIPLFPVLIGSPRKPVDITVTDLDFPTSVFLGDTPRLTATLATTGFAGRALEVILQPASGAAMRKMVNVEADTTTVAFDWPADSAGRSSFSLSVAAQPEELRDDNNSAEFALTVVDDTIRVLLIEEEARWEFRFIDNAFLRDSRVDVAQVIFEQPFLNVLDASFFPRQLDWPDDPAAWDKSALAETDVVIVGDVSQTHLTPADWESLDRYVDAGRGTLVLLAGKNHATDGELPPALQRLLPVSDLRIEQFAKKSAQSSPSERGFHLALTPEGEREPMLQFAADPQANREIWRNFPGHVWGMTGTAKPGASVLATMVPPADAPPGTSKNRAILARQTYGLGQVLWLGIDSTWRWRHRAGDRYHHRFWGQLARWGARQQSLGGTDSVKFGFERSDIAQGETAVVRARFNRVFLERYPQLTATAELVAAGESRILQTLPLTPSPGRPLAYEGEAVDLPPGEYTARLKVDGADLGAAEFVATLFVSQPPTKELTDLSANAELLSQLATVSGGRLIGPDDLSELPQLLNAAEAAHGDRDEVALWQHPLLLLLFCALVTTEWVVRKLNGLP